MYTNHFTNLAGLLSKLKLSLNVTVMIILIIHKFQSLHCALLYVPMSYDELPCSDSAVAARRRQTGLKGEEVIRGLNRADVCDLVSRLV